MIGLENQFSVSIGESFTIIVIIQLIKPTKD